MKNKVLNQMVIAEIQKYLTDMMNQRPAIHQIEEKLDNFLKGAQYALWQDGLTFKLVKEKPDNNRSFCTDFNAVYRVDVMRYDDPNSCWGDKHKIFSIYEHCIKE